MEAKPVIQDDELAPFYFSRYPSGGSALKLILALREWTGRRFWFYSVCAEA